jgi:hypothetical protein
VTTANDPQDSRQGAAAIAWSGDDPVVYTRALAALEEAEIPVFEIAEHDQFVMVPQISGPGYRILIAQSDASRAEKAIREALDSTQQE